MDPLYLLYLYVIDITFLLPILSAFASANSVIDHCKSKWALSSFDLCREHFLAAGVGSERSERKPWTAEKYLFEWLEAGKASSAPLLPL